MTRQAKTPQRRAEEKVTALENRFDRLQKRRDHAREVVAEIDTEIRNVTQRLTYARQDPALPQEDNEIAYPDDPTPDEPADPGEPDTDEEQK